MVLELAILLLLALLFYAWVLYPLMLAAFMHGRKLSVSPGGRSAGPRSVAVLLAAYNEEDHIGVRLQNLVETTAPLVAAGIPVEIHVGVDGSTDRTAALARDWAGRAPNIHTHEFPVRRGKVSVLKELVQKVGADVVVFTDANTFFHNDALQRLLAPFRDATVGGVCGRLVLRPREEKSSTPPERSYWDWEARLKEYESRLDSCLGANGAIYAIRRELFWRDIPNNTRVDDFVIGMKVREQGRRLLYEPAAVAEEDLPDSRHEWRRRVRIGTGDYQALVFCRRCLLPRFGRFAWMFWSHKVLRWFTPHMVIAVALLAAVGVVFPSRTSRLPWLAPAVVCVLAAGLVTAWAGRLLEGAQWARTRCFRPLGLWSHFVTMQLALFAGFLKFCRGNLEGTWERTPRNG